MTKSSTPSSVPPSQPFVASTSPPTKTNRLLHDTGLILCGVVIGMITVCYLSTDRGPMVMVGTLLPFGADNEAARHNYNNEIGATRDELIRRYGIHRVEVVDVTDIDYHSVYGHGGPGDLDLSKEFSEIWLLPTKARGICSYIVLGFDHSGKLCHTAQSEFMVGFPVRRSDR